MNFDVYNPDGVLIASVIYAEDAACLIALYGDGATIRFRDYVLWHEGRETQNADESYDHVASLVLSRLGDLI